MIRDTLCTAIQPGPEVAPVPENNVTVFENNDPFPVFGPLAVEQSLKEGCSSRQS